MTEVMKEINLKTKLALILLCVAICGYRSSLMARSPQAGVSPGVSAEQLYLQLRSVGLDANRVYEIRDAPLDYDQVHISLDHGTIAFSSDVYGKVTGAFFEGEGEVLVIPPDQAERASMTLFTGAAILEDRFATAYFRFNDDSFAGLQPYLSSPTDAADFISRWSAPAKNLAEWDALRMFMSFSRCLPSDDTPTASNSCSIPNTDRFLHARIQTPKLGIYDLTYDASSTEEISIGQQKTVEGVNYYNVWASFSVAQGKSRRQPKTSDELLIRSYDADIQVHPPTELRATTSMKVEVLAQGARVLSFELSRFLKIKEVTMDDHPLAFIQNQALDGTQLARRGNDVVVLIFPEALKAGQKLELKFVYGGDVLSEAGGGLLYVGARGIWYPNRGMAAANFDLRFRYPAGWTLLATGRRLSSNEDEESNAAQPTGERVSHWVTKIPIPVAGFNLGKYFRTESRSGDVSIETYAAAGVERTFPKPPDEIAVRPRLPSPLPRSSAPEVVLHPPISPVRNAQSVSNDAASAVSFLSQRFGPFPYETLRLTQMPGPLSQGWPGLIFLSSYSFLSPEDRSHLSLGPVDQILARQVTAHETGHQWWGDLVYWRGYRDQWLFEGLANYCSLMMLEAQDPVSFQRIMTKYRDNLLQKNKAGAVLKDAGPVTLGLRLSSSEFPDGYEAISYGRGTWLFHMLRHMLNDGTGQDKPLPPTEQPFTKALRKIRDRYAGKPITTREFLQGFESELPPAVKYEGREKLDWFYEGWINGTAIPHLELRGVKLTAGENSVSARGTILQRSAPKELATSVPLFARLRNNRRVFVTRIFADGPETAFHVNAPAGTVELLIDPEQTLLKN